MFEVGFTEIILIVGLALLVLGPEKLPGLAEKIGRWTGRARAMARQLRTQLEHEVTMEELTKSRPHGPASTAQPASPATPPESTSAASHSPSTAHSTAAPHGGAGPDLNAAAHGSEPAKPDESPAAEAAPKPMPTSAP